MGSKSMSGRSTARRYSPEEKARAVRLVRQLRKELGTTRGTVQRVADQIGCGVESLRTWVKQADVDEGVEPGLSTAEALRIKELEQENRELRRANDLLKRASAFFAAELEAHRGDRRVRRRAPGRVRSRVHLQRTCRWLRAPTTPRRSGGPPRRHAPFATCS
jgi:transposase